MDLSDHKSFHKTTLPEVYEISHPTFNEFQYEALVHQLSALLLDKSFKLKDPRIGTWKGSRIAHHVWLWNCPMHQPCGSSQDEVTTRLP